MSELRTRHNIWTLVNENPADPWHPVVLAYARAIRVMKERSAANAADPTGWTYQAQIHGMAPNPQDGFRNKCQHFSWFFLPWHRMYLFHFESIIRSVVEELDTVDDETKATWALPYWNYLDGQNSRRLPVVFRRQTWPDAGPNPLFNATRFFNINNGSPISDVDADYLAALKPAQFTGATQFGGPKTGETHGGEDPNSANGPLEGSPHGTVHIDVGGDMQDFNKAGRDPIFWLHHSNIDRIWDVWLGQGGGRANPTDPAWRNAIEFKFHDEAGAESRMTVDDVLDSENQLNYVYEDISGPAGPLEGEEEVVPEPDNPPQLVGATEQPVQLTGDTASVSFPVTEPAGPLEGEAPSRVYLRLEDLTSQARPGVSYGVYLNVPDGDDQTPDDHYVGTASMFGVQEATDVDNDHPGMRMVFDITDLYQRLNDAGLWTDQVSVRFAPRYIAEPAGPQAPDEEVPGTAQEPGDVKVGQVSVFFQ
jgi:tyrosinase